MRLETFIRGPSEGRLSNKGKTMKPKISLLSCVVALLLCSLSSVQGQLAPALYVLGDSLSDVGNNNYLNTTAYGKYLPYGLDFKRGPTGRFTNGKIIADFFAEFLGLPYAPPFLGLSEEEKHSITTGVNYASAGGGILPESTYTAGQIISLSQQVDFFKTTLEHVRSNFKDREEFLDYLAESIFFVNVGANDYVNNYLRPADYQSSSIYSPQEFARFLVDKLSLQLERLYNLGARKIIVFELMPLGCSPFNTNSKILSSVCVEEINSLAAAYNARLLERVVELNSTLSGSIFVYGSTYIPFYHLYHNPMSYGFEERDKNVPCCPLADGRQCTPRISPCALRNKRLFWDANHPTEAVYQMQAAGCWNQSNTIAICTPNIQQLTQLKANTIPPPLALDIQRFSRVKTSS